MGAVQLHVLAYLVWVNKEHRGQDGAYLDSDGKRGVSFESDPAEATHFETRTDAETFIMLDSGKHPDLIGLYEIRAIVAGYAIRYQKVESEPVSRWGQEEYTINQTRVMYVGANGSIVGNLDEAAKFSSREKAETISFNMALKDKSLLGAVEVIQINHIQRA